MGTEHPDYYARFARATRSSVPVTLIGGSAEAIPIESEAYGRDVQRRSEPVLSSVHPQSQGITLCITGSLSSKANGIQPLMLK